MGKPKACWECHSRRLICDFGRPGCQKCQSRNTACPGYGPQKPLKWLQPGQTRSKGQRARKEANIIKLTLKDPSGSTSIFEAIEYYNTHICPDLAANGAGGGSNCSWVLHPGEAPYIPIAIRHTLVSIALAHRVLQSEQGFEEDRALFSARLQKHRGEAIRYLAEDLKPGSQPDAITLASILTFLLAEIQQSFSSSWRQHCDAANAVVDLLGGMETVMRCYIIIRPVVRYFFCKIEILSTTTAPTVEEARTRRQVDVAGFLSDILNTGLCTSIPCPPELLAHIVLVNNHLAQAQAHEGALFCIDSQISAMNLLHRIRSFSVEKWAIEIDFNERKLNENPNKPLAQRQSVSWDWQSVAYVYQSAVVLYCISSLLYPQYTQNTPQKLNQDTSIGDLRSAYLATLLCNLRDISSNSKLQLRKLLLWPLVIAGIEVDVNDEKSKRFILGELAWISKVVGTAPPLVARDFLVKLWASDWIPTGYGRGGWNTIFDRPNRFSLEKLLDQNPYLCRYGHVALAVVVTLKRRSEGRDARKVPGLVHLFKIAYAASVNTMNIHGMAYSGEYHNTTWPGFSIVQYFTGAVWNQRFQAWKYLDDAMTFAERMQLVLQAGTIKRDVAFYLYKNPWSASDEFEGTGLHNSSYSYEYLGPTNLESDEATVEDGVLAIGAAQKVLEFAQGGLPIVIIGNAPNMTIGQSESSRQKVMSESMSSLATLDNVKFIDDAKLLPDALSALKAQPRVSVSAETPAPGLWSVWRETEDADLIYLYNANETATFNLTFEVADDKIPYQLDAWTGEQRAWKTYQRTETSVSLSLTLAADQTTIFAFAEHCGPKILHVTSHSANIEMIWVGEREELIALVNDSSSL
ncbi:hypothetical protein FDECE_4380 [Fusarium decemcellulare]|nr:hypothetical protein FDECE_4380 [Fusarium decemcellulare]